MLKGCKKLNLSVHSVGRIPGGYVTNHIYTWVDPQGRSVSPPTGLPHHQSSSLRRDSEKRSHLQLLQEGDEKKVSKKGSHTDSPGSPFPCRSQPSVFPLGLSSVGFSFSIMVFSMGLELSQAAPGGPVGWVGLALFSLTQGEAGLEGRGGIVQRGLAGKEQPPNLEWVLRPFPTGGMSPWRTSMSSLETEKP